MSRRAGVGLSRAPAQGLDRLEDMNRRTLSFIALVISMVYGALFAVIGEEQRTAYAVIGGVVVAIAWISVGVFGRDAGQRQL